MDKINCNYYKKILINVFLLYYYIYTLYLKQKSYVRLQGHDLDLINVYTYEDFCLSLHVYTCVKLVFFMSCHKFFNQIKHDQFMRL